MLFRVVKPVLRVAYRQTRGMTRGTRIVVLKANATEVLLVRHGYAPGWLLPGGGVLCVTHGGVKGSCPTRGRRNHQLRIQMHRDH